MMGRKKNALRGHFVQAYVKGAEPVEEEWLELAEWISDITDATQEATEETAYYSGDGTPEEEVTSVAGAYNVEGTYDSTDPAQEFIAGLKYKTGEGRKVWHKVVASNGEKEWVARATVSGIIAGSGNAGEFEAFNCNIRFDTLPTEKELTPGG